MVTINLKANVRLVLVHVINALINLIFAYNVIQDLLCLYLEFANAVQVLM